MFLASLSVILQGAIGLYFFAVSSFLMAALVFTALDFWPLLKCNDQPPWWRNKSIQSDILYVAFNPIFKVSLRLLPLALVTVSLFPIFTLEDIYTYLANGRGPLGQLSPSLQCLVFLVLSDFLLYWNHRLFHRAALLWPLHAIHHGPTNPDWTTAYRFHPLNFALGPWLITTLMVFLGISPQNIILIAPFEAVMAFFVHSNLNIKLGLFRYLIATPVFHRWHHVKHDPGLACNYGAILSLWDVAFGTFYLPSERLPGNYGVEYSPVPDSFVSQLLYPLLAILRVVAVWPKSIARTIGNMSSAEPKNRG